MALALAPRKRLPLYCSFCGKEKGDVAYLVAGPTVFICNECVELCRQIGTEILVENGVATVSDEMVERGRIAIRDVMVAGGGPVPTKNYAASLARACLTAALSDQVAGWQPIETAPKYNDVLVWVPFAHHGGGMRQIARYDHEDGGWIDDNDDKISDAYSPTLWQPLPAPPELTAVPASTPVRSS